MPSQHRKHRGYKSQAVVADYLAAHGFPHAQPVGAGRSGSDITGALGLAVEVKARADLQPLTWLRQAHQGARPGDLPCVVFRPNGMGEASVEQWGVLLDLATFVDLVRDAGHGDPREGPTR